MIKAIVFDLGGVIFNANFDKDYQTLCSKYKVKDSRHLFDIFKTEWDNAKVSEITDDEFYKIISKKVGAKEDEIKSVFINNIKINKKMRDLVLVLKENYKIGILTNTIEDIYNTQLDIWNFEEIAEVITSFKEHTAKPEETAINLILNKLGVEKDEVIFIDDHIDTMKKYSELGIACILFKGYKELITKLESYKIKI